MLVSEKQKILSEEWDGSLCEEENSSIENFPLSGYNMTQNKSMMKQD